MEHGVQLASSVCEISAKLLQENRRKKVTTPSQLRCQPNQCQLILLSHDYLIVLVDACNLIAASSWLSQ